VYICTSLSTGVVWPFLLLFGGIKAAQRGAEQLESKHMEFSDKLSEKFHIASGSLKLLLLMTLHTGLICRCFT